MYYTVPIPNYTLDIGSRYEPIVVCTALIEPEPVSARTIHTSSAAP